MFTSMGEEPQGNQWGKDEIGEEWGKESEAHWMEGEMEGISNKGKQSVEHECLQDFAWLERKKGVYGCLKRDRKTKVLRTQHVVRI